MLMDFKTIDETLNWVMSRRRSGQTFEQFKDICKKLNNPQNGFYTIHVAGTDGKGSTCAFLRDLLMEYGFEVGTYTSPHYLTHLDRIRINNINIPGERFEKYLDNRYELIMKYNLSMFEIDYLIMCDYFKDENVDFAIVEVGLGGRLDATNVVDDTKLSVITTIGYDHMERLGNTLEEICFEKCGIIKPDSKVLMGHLNDECTKVVEEVCKKRNSTLYKLGELIDKEDRSFEYNGNEYKLRSYAKYQIHNASLALNALDIISKDKGFELDVEKSRKAIGNSMWQCRFEVVKENPRVILDGAHNIHGIEALTNSFDQFTGSKCIIFSALKRKEYQKMVDELKKHTDELIITTFPNNEVIDLKDFNNENCFDDYKAAIDYAIKKYDNVLICGSLYFMSEIALNYKFD